MSDLLPANALPSERAMSLAVARAADIETPVRTLHDPDTCPAALLPWLAWAESVDEWQSSWTDSQKRAAIKASREIHARKGTAAALRLAVAALGFDVEIREWFQETPPRPPFTFRGVFEVDQVGLPDDIAYDAIVSAANSAKNLRSHMTGVDILGVSGGTEWVGAAAYCSAFIDIGPEEAP